MQDYLSLNSVINSELFCYYCRKNSKSLASITSQHISRPSKKQGIKIDATKSRRRYRKITCASGFGAARFNHCRKRPARRARHRYEGSSVKRNRQTAATFRGLLLLVTPPSDPRDPVFVVLRAAAVAPDNLVEDRKWRADARAR